MTMMNTTEIPTEANDLHADVIDLRDLADILEQLRALIDEHDEGEHGEGDENEECPECDPEWGLLGALEELEMQLFEPSLRKFAENEPVMVADTYFERYAEEMAEEIGAIDREANWPLNRIDWAAAADDLKEDYTSVTFAGVEYYVRAY